VIAVAILVYVILDGFDLGVGIPFGTTSDASLRSQMTAAISPFWDGNETWLVVIGASFYAAFPVVYTVFLPAFYIPVLLLLLGLIFRSVAFELRSRARGLWGVLHRLRRGRLRPGCRRWHDDLRHSGREPPICPGARLNG
jgi:cytochrome d ubiquinol oxidase subunit II